MIIVGELINASRKDIRSAIQEKDAYGLQRLAQEQREAGADYIDVNAGVFAGQEPEYLAWLVQVVQQAVDAPCCIDSPDPKAIEAALKVHDGASPAMINSISLEKERYDALLTLLAGTDLKIVALCMSDEGMPETSDERLQIAGKLIEGLTGKGVSLSNIFVDPLVQPLSTRDDFGAEFLRAVEGIMTRFPGVHTICGLSNISYGLPERKLLNRTFAAMALAKGLDGLIIDPLDRGIIAHLIAAEALAGHDKYCTKYLKAYRSKKLQSP
jgi:cobalamin-dependent methionine synthase I